MELDYELAGTYEDERWNEMGVDALPPLSEVLSVQEILATAVPDSTEYNDAKAILASIQRTDALLEQSIPVNG